MNQKKGGNTIPYIKKEIKVSNSSTRWHHSQIKNWPVFWKYFKCFDEISNMFQQNSNPNIKTCNICIKHCRICLELNFFWQNSQCNFLMHFLAVRDFLGISQCHQHHSKGYLLWGNREKTRKPRSFIGNLIISFAVTFFLCYMFRASINFSPSAVFEYLFFRNGKDWFEGTLGCFKEPKPSLPFWRSPGLVYHNRKLLTAACLKWL